MTNQEWVAKNNNKVELQKKVQNEKIWVWTRLTEDSQTNRI